MEIDASTTALVTGANGGIGAAIARAIHASGAKVILSGRREDALGALANELGARIVVADQSQPRDVERLCDEAAEADLAVLNAAVPAAGDLFDLEPDAIDDIVRVNLTSPIHSARILGRGMASRGRGQIVLISSISGIVASPGASLYSATKFGLRGFALSLRAELRAHGVGVTTIYPGFIRDAGMFANAGVPLPAGVGSRTPEDVAVAVMRAVRRNPAEITVAAFDQKVAAFVASVAPGLVDVAAGSRAAKKFSRDLANGHREHARKRLR